MRTALIHLAQILHRDNNHQIKKEIDEYIISEGAYKGIPQPLLPSEGATKVRIPILDLEFKHIIISINPVTSDQRNEL